MLSLLTLLTGCASLVAGADFISTLKGTSDLSNLTYYLDLFPSFLDTLNSTDNITILAPSNEAFQNTLKDQNSQFADARVVGYVDTVLSYHIVNGTWASSSISSTPQFLSTWLTDHDWTIVTGGQVVEAVTVNDQPQFISGFGKAATVKTSDVYFDGGIIQIIDNILVMPYNSSRTVAGLDMPVASIVFANQTLQVGIDTAFTDLTVFIPNDQAMLAVWNDIQYKSIPETLNILGYHMVIGTRLYSPDFKNQSLATYTNNNEDIQMSIINGDYFVNSAKIIKTDILVNAGVAHILDAVMNPANTTVPPNPQETGPVLVYSPVPTPTLTTSSSSTGPTNVTAASPSASANSSSNLSSGAYAGIGVGAAAGALAVVGLVSFFCIRRRRQMRDMSSDTNSRSSSDAEKVPGFLPRSAGAVRRNNRKPKKGILKSPRPAPVEVPTGEELAAELETHPQPRSPELDSKTIMSQIPQDIYENRAELDADGEIDAVPSYEQSNANEQARRSTGGRRGTL
ncbi:MAG: hypothetical protein Q9227_001762 [Pyrenula ochraceoflavens]